MSAAVANEEILNFVTSATSAGKIILGTFYINRGRRVIGISGSRIWSKTLMELIFNPCGEFRPEGPVSQIHSPNLRVGAPGIFSDLLRFVQMLKRKWRAESNRKLPHLFISGKTVAMAPEFTVEDLPSTELQP